MFMPLAFVEAPVPMFPKRGILKCLYRCEQNIDQVIMEPEVLVRDESHQMNVNIVIGPAAQIGRAHSGDATREISNTLRTEVQDGQDRRHFGVELFHHAEILPGVPGFWWVWSIVTVS